MSGVSEVSPCLCFPSRTTFTCVTPLCLLWLEASALPFPLCGLPPLRSSRSHFLSAVSLRSSHLAVISAAHSLSLLLSLHVFKRELRAWLSRRWTRGSERFAPVKHAKFFRQMRCKTRTGAGIVLLDNLYGRRKAVEMLSCCTRRSCGGWCNCLG